MDLKIIRAMIKHVFSFQGRIGRSEYFCSYVATCLYSSLNDNIDFDYFFIYLIGLVIFGVFIIAQAAKRCHDLGQSGWFQLIPFYVFWLIFKKGEQLGNQYENALS